MVEIMSQSNVKLLLINDRNNSTIFCDILIVGLSN